MKIKFHSITKASFLILMLLSSITTLKAQNIYSVVGTGSSGTPADGGAAISSSLVNINGVSFDASGNMYVCDISDHTIRKVNLTTGIITTVVGTHGSAGSSGDGGLATAALINYPVNVIFDGSGNMYFSDLFGHKVRKVNTSGVISTFAGTGTAGSSGDGGAATSATLNQPTGLAADKLGNIYVSEINGMRIRMINTSGTISTIAGNGSATSTGDGAAATAATLNKPRGMVFDTTGNLYVVEEQGHRVRMINTSGVISTIAGNGTASTSGDGGAATSATINSPRGIIMDSLGNIFFTEGGGYVIRKITPAGTISTFAGTGVSGFSGDGGAATAAKLSFPLDIAMFRNNIYFGDYSVATVRMICVGGPAAPTVSAPPVVNYCQGSTASALTATGYTLKWYTAATGGTALSGAPTPVTTTAGVTYYYVGQTYFNAGCESVRARVQVNINPKPDSVLINPLTRTSFCVGDSVVLQASARVKIVGSTPFFLATGWSSSSSTTPCNCPNGYVATGYSGKTGTILDGFRLMCTRINRITGGLSTTFFDSTNQNGGFGGSIHGPFSYTPNGVLVGAYLTDAFFAANTLNKFIGYGQDMSTIKAFGSNTSSPLTLTALSGGASDNANGTIIVPDGCVVTGMTGDNGYPYSHGVSFQYTPIGAFQYSYSWSTGDTTNSITVKTSTTINLTATNSYGCSSAATPVTITSTAFPVAPTVTAPVNLCLGGGSSAITAIKANATDTLIWYTAATGGTGTATAPTPSTATAGTTTYYVSERTTPASCEGPRASLSVTVNNRPAAPTVTSPVVYCQGVTPAALVATGTNLLWYTAATGGTGSSTKPTVSTTTPGTFTYYVSQTSAAATGGCEGARAVITVTVNSTPTAPVVVTPVTYCVNATASALSASTLAATDTVLWYSAATGGTGSTTTPTPSTASSGTTLYYVSLKTNSGCEGPRSTITVNINPLPSAPTVTSSLINLCVGGPTTALAATGTNLKWYTVATGGTSSSTAPTISTATASSNVYYVSSTITATGCEGPRTAITVNVNALPSAPAVTTPINLCVGGVSSILTASGSNILWYTAATGGTGSSTAPIPSTATVGSSSFYVTQTSAASSGSCESPRAAINVIVNALPVAPTVVTPINICIGIPGTPLTAIGTNLNWYTTAAGGASVPTPTPTTTATGSTTYYVSQTSSVGCEGPRSGLTINVQPAPTLNLTPVGVPGFVYCDSRTVTIKATSAIATAFQWSKAGLNIPGATYDTLVVNSTAYYGMKVTSFYGCITKDSVLVTSDPLPVPILTPTDIQQCEGVSIVLYCKPASAGYTYMWMKDGAPMGLSLSTSSVPVTLKGDYTVTVTDIYTCVKTTNSAIVTTYPAIVKPTIIRLDPVLKLSKTYAHHQWYRNDMAIAGATASSYTISYDGSYYAMVSDVTECYTYSDTVQVSGLGIKGSSVSNSQIKVYPNPSRNIVNIDAPIKVNVMVTDVVGKLILNKKDAKSVDLGDYADGTYFFKIMDENDQLISVQKINKISNGQ